MTEKTIGELPLATVVNNYDLLEIEQSGVSKRAPSSLIGSYLSANIVRVDLSGDDSTGTVGDLTKPFLTFPAAIAALEAQGGFQAGSPAVVILPVNDTALDVTTSLEYLALVGVGEFNVSAPAIGRITFSSTGAVILGVHNLYVNGVLAPNLSNTLEIHLNTAYIDGDITAANEVLVLADLGVAAVNGTITCGDGTNMMIVGLVGATDALNIVTVCNAPNSSLSIYRSIVNTLTAASSVDLYDARILTNNSGVTPTYHDVLLNPALMDFSTLPTSPAGLPAGAAWVDPASSFVVKISQGPV